MAKTWGWWIRFCFTNIGMRLSAAYQLAISTPWDESTESRGAYKHYGRAMALG